MKLDILFEDSDVIVLNKPFGLVVNSSETTSGETLQDMLGKHFGLEKGDLGIGDRAGIVHRLDRETSGVLAVAKNVKTFEDLQEKFKNREVEKKYVALVHGVVDEEGIVEQKIARVGKFGRFGVASSGRESMTRYKKISGYRLDDEEFGKLLTIGGYNKSRERYLRVKGRDYSLVEVMPKTGRTHQIRVHLKHIGHPLVSDTIYCPGKLLKFDLSWCPRLFLHATAISIDKIMGKSDLSVQAPLPKELKMAMGELKLVD